MYHRSSIRKVSPESTVYYWAKLFSGQLGEGQDYDELRPTYSICFLDGKLASLAPDVYHHRFELVDRSPGGVLSEHVGLHIIEFPKFALGEDEIATLEEVWCYFLRHADALDTDRMPAAMNKPLVMKAMEVLMRMSQDAVERERYESRLKWERDQRQREKDQRQRENDAKKREDDARKEGVEVGEHKGAYYGEIRTLQLVLKRPETPKQELAKLSLDELRRIADELKQQITAG